MGRCSRISRLQFPNKEKLAFSTKFIVNNAIRRENGLHMNPSYSLVFHLIGFRYVLVINYFAPVENYCFLTIRSGTAVYSFSLAHLLASFSCHAAIQTLVTCWRNTFLHKSTHLVSFQFCSLPHQNFVAAFPIYTRKYRPIFLRSFWYQ